jgi:sialic acid synthase SpsE
MINLPKPILEIQGKKIGRDFPTYFISHIAINHGVDLTRAKALIVI